MALPVFRNDADRRHSHHLYHGAGSHVQVHPSRPVVRQTRELALLGDHLPRIRDVPLHAIQASQEPVLRELLAAALALLDGGQLCLDERCLDRGQAARVRQLQCTRDRHEALLERVDGLGFGSPAGDLQLCFPARFADHFRRFAEEAPEPGDELVHQHARGLRVAVHLAGDRDLRLADLHGNNREEHLGQHLPDGLVHDQCRHLGDDDRDHLQDALLLHHAAQHADPCLLGEGERGDRQGAVPATGDNCSDPERAKHGRVPAEQQHHDLVRPQRRHGHRHGVLDHPLHHLPARV